VASREAGESLRGAGGTSGGLLEFLIGAAMAIAGGYLLTTNVSVTSGYWGFWGADTFGITLIPFICGVIALFFNGSSKVGWVLMLAGLLIIFVGIIANLHIYFRSTSLFNTLVMLVLLAGGIGLLARSLRPHGD